MDIQVFSDNASTTLAADITSGTTAMTVASAALFPSTLTNGDWFIVTIQEIVDDLVTAQEIVKVTAVAGVNWTIVRDQEGTGAQPWVTGNTVAMLYTAGTAAQFLQRGNLYLTTPAETGASITPSNEQYPEGDIRRYGALTTAADNHLALTAALTVSGAGGNPAFIPGGNWAVGSGGTAVVAAPGSSMRGAGTASKLIVSNGIDGIQFTASDSGIIPRSRSFRDFQILGTQVSGANAAHAVYIDTGVISHCTFENLSISGFEYGIFSQGLYYSTLYNCFIQNCYQGIYFNNQSVNIAILECVIQLVPPPGGTLITGSGDSVGISVQGAPEVEGLHITGGSIYGFAYDFKSELIFECQIEAVDISYATKCPIFFQSTIGGLVIRDCWIELGSASTSGTWNDGGTGTGNLTGIFIEAITPSTNAKVHIHGNYVISDGALPGSGSTGIYIGNSNNGISVFDNHVLNWDIGIGGGNTLNAIGSASNGMVIQYNTINATTSSILLSSACAELVLGPNYIVAGGQVAFNSTPPTSMVYSQPNVPMKGTAAFASATTTVVTFANAMPFATYRVSLSGNAAGYCWVTSKATTGFTINCSVSNSNSVDWAISA